MKWKYIKSKVYLFKYLIFKENMLGLGINRMYTNQVNFITISVKFNILDCTYVLKLHRQLIYN